jgi:hypothetical protein
MDAAEQLKQDVRDGRIDIDRLIDVIGTLQRQLEAAKQRIEELERKTGVPTPPAAAKVDAPFSVREEEKRQKKRGRNQHGCDQLTPAISREKEAPTRRFA